MSDNNQAKSDKNWVPTTNRFVCFLDIMGFKDMVMRSTHKEIYELLTKISKNRSQLDRHLNIPTIYNISDPLKTVSFSDSIIIFTKDDSEECFELMTIAIGWLFAESLNDGIPMKGAISHGQMSINISNQIFFGQPLIDAYLLEEEVNYYGIVIHNTVEKYLSKNMINAKVKKRYVDIPTPLKSGTINHLNLDWIISLKSKKGMSEKSIGLELMSIQRNNTSGYPRKYIDNTIKVINELYE